MNIKNNIGRVPRCPEARKRAKVDDMLENGDIASGAPHACHNIYGLLHSQVEYKANVVFHN